MKYARTGTIARRRGPRGRTAPMSQLVSVATSGTYTRGTSLHAGTGQDVSLSSVETVMAGANARQARHADVRVGIVGAGISGLAAALALHDRGIPTTIFEAADRVGGRMHTDGETWENGQTSEWCAELIDSDHTAVLELIDRFGLPLVDLWTGSPLDAEDTLFFEGQYYPRHQATRDFDPVWQILEEQLEAAGYPTTWDNFTPAARELDEMSIAGWIGQLSLEGSIRRWDVLLTLRIALSSAGIPAIRARSISCISWAINLTLRACRCLACRMSGFTSRAETNGFLARWRGTLRLKNRMLPSMSGIGSHALRVTIQVGAGSPW